ncbi:hypothetical protein BTN82_08955 [Pseudomonas chlororaphis]|uniref:Uncharacterized protein n=1 Tax=Pseudomonas chlororaphis TaxID=587753 RepID=A0A1Q8ETJ4_9PSED|nr:hypothetical protein BTN82_08955 [Pseudomonas chlororaphis]
MSFCVGRQYGRSTGPGLWGQNEKTPQPVSPGARRVCDVFVVGGATAVGYLWRLQSQNCAKNLEWGLSVFDRCAVDREPARSCRGRRMFM